MKWIRAGLLEKYERACSSFIRQRRAGAPVAVKIWRIGQMGHTARKENVERFLDALRKSIA